MVAFLHSSPSCWSITARTSSFYRYCAAAVDQLDIVAYLADHGAVINSAACGGQTPLIIASCHGHSAVVQLLVDRGADLLPANDNGDAVLALATESEHAEVVAILEPAVAAALAAAPAAN